MDVKTYKGNVFTLKIKQMDKALLKLKKMRKNCDDLSPVLLDTVEAFKINMQATFRAKQSPDNIPKRWALLSPKYNYIKYGNKVRRVANLIGVGINGGALQRAVYGGLGWYQNISPLKAEFGIIGIPYAARHNYGDTVPIRGARMPQRAYFTRSDGGLPQAVINYLVGKIEEKFQGVV